MKKKYVIESKGFTQGLGSASYSKKISERLEEIKRQLKDIEELENIKDVLLKFQDFIQETQAIHFIDKEQNIKEFINNRL